jgi:hypothetical protein
MTNLTRPDTAHVKAGPAFSFLWLEITGRCGLPIDRTSGRHADVMVVRAGG